MEFELRGPERPVVSGRILATKFSESQALERGTEPRPAWRKGSVWSHDGGEASLSRPQAFDLMNPDDDNRSVLSIRPLTTGLSGPLNSNSMGAPMCRHKFKADSPRRTFTRTAGLAFGSDIPEAVE
jgi:hypothetical protein